MVRYVRYPILPLPHPPNHISFPPHKQSHDFASLFLASESSEVLRHNCDLPQCSFVLSAQATSLEISFVTTGTITRTRWQQNGSLPPLQIPTIHHELRPPFPPLVFHDFTLQNNFPFPTLIPHRSTPGWWGFGEAAWLADPFSCSSVFPCFLFYSWPHCLFLSRLTPHKFTDFNPNDGNPTSHFFIPKPGLLKTLHFILFTEGIAAYIGISQVLAVMVVMCIC